MYQNSLNYYYYILEPTEKRVYEALFVSYRKMESETFLKGIYDGKEVLRIIQYVYNDNPEFFYIEPTEITYCESVLGIKVIHKYRYGRKQKEEYDRKIKTAAEAFIKQWIRQGMSLYEKLQAVNDFLATTVRYDPVVSNAKNTEGKTIRGNYEDYSIVGPLVNRMGVCHGISMTAKYLCDILGIQCMVVTGMVKNEGKHAWNIVYTGKNEGKRFYHWDPTFNLTNDPRSRLRYRYFMVDDRELEKNREWNKKECPACSWKTWDHGKKSLLGQIVYGGRRGRK